MEELNFNEKYLDVGHEIKCIFDLKRKYERGLLNNSYNNTLFIHQEKPLINLEKELNRMIELCIPFPDVYVAELRNGCWEVLIGTELLLNAFNLLKSNKLEERFKARLEDRYVNIIKFRFGTNRYNEEAVKLLKTVISSDINKNLK